MAISVFFIAVWVTLGFTNGNLSGARAWKLTHASVKHGPGSLIFLNKVTLQFFLIFFLYQQVKPKEVGHFKAAKILLKLSHLGMYER